MKVKTASAQYGADFYKKMNELLRWIYVFAYLWHPGTKLKKTEWLYRKPYKLFEHVVLFSRQMLQK